MKVHIRFRQGLDAYPKGSSHYLPDELADHYIRAGVAELVDSVPKPVLEAEKPSPAEAKQESSKADDGSEDKPEAEDGSTKKATGSKRRSKS